ncbi:hypothetical protein C806_03024 [Lachnospiraceae bacterium 3-1]|nr:hypothetical protein C806_03024 [Lachnospiraceae bacterium 3-1]
MKVMRKFCSRLLMVFGLAMAIGLLSPQMEVNAKTPTITVKKVDQNTAKKVHKQLMKGKAFKLRIKGGEENFIKQFQKLSKKVATCTDEGFNIFPICMETSMYFGYNGGRNPKTSGGYTSFNVTKGDCQEYIYGIKFARREYKDFKAYVDKALKESEYLLSVVNTDKVYVDEVNYKSRAALTKDVEKTIANLRELSKYLKKTKFRNLSGAMKARVVLEVGGREWGKPAMCMSWDKPKFNTSFKALYQRKAHGHIRKFTDVACKTCAVFDIGEYDQIKGRMGTGPDVDEAVRVKLKTSSGKVRYAVVEVGEFCPHNDYVGFDTWREDTTYRCWDQKNHRTVKKIKKTQQLRSITLIKRQKAVYELSPDGINLGKALVIYGLDVPKSEW